MIMFPLARQVLLIRSLTVLSLALSALCLSARGDEAVTKQPDEKRAKFFETEVRPLLVEKCQICHGDFIQESNFRLDSREGLLAGGKSGKPAIVPGQPEKSLLVEAIRRKSLAMPPDEPLSKEDIAILVHWIAQGAYWPDHGGAAMRSAPRELFSEEDRGWWAIQPVTDPPVPEIANEEWARNPIDHFIGRRLAEARLAPAPEADRRVLIRRLSFDLTGLPPTPEQVAAFVADTEPGAYARLVDRLLESPAYGQRWARHWLDLARYADSDGYRADHYRPNAWRYRDYVIESFNEDKPYDRFVQEQLAGDELFPGDPEALIATGYLAQGIYEYNNRAVRDQWRVMLEDITDTTGDVFLGLGFQCAKCHNHKFDPILQRDYYRLRSFFEGVWLKNRVAATGAEKKEYAREMAKWRAKAGDIQEELEAIKKPYREKAAFGAIEMFPEDIQAMMRTPSEARAPREDQLAKLAYRQVVLAQEGVSYSKVDKKKIATLGKQLDKFNDLKPAPLPRCRAAVEIGPQAPPTTIPGRPDDVIKPGFLSILEREAATITPPEGVENSTGRRSALALWLTGSDNPLTPRVMVNRVWQHHFGRGLAPNPSDFGRLGGPPSHPELLDWLTTRFIQNGWHLKPLHRLIVTSATYRQSSRHPKRTEFARIDPRNQWYWHAPTHRLDAGQIRDAILAVTGRLDKTAGGAGVKADVPRRTIYMGVRRNTRDPLLDAFDLPTFFASTAVRQTTTTAMQSLLLINSERMIDHAHNLAAHVSEMAKDSPHDRIETAWLLAYGRLPTDSEHEAAARFLVGQAARITSSKNEAGSKDMQAAPTVPNPEQAAFVDFCHGLLNSNEFLYVE